MTTHQLRAARAQISVFVHLREANNALENILELTLSLLDSLCILLPSLPNSLLVNLHSHQILLMMHLPLTIHPHAHHYSTDEVLTRPVALHILSAIF